MSREIIIVGHKNPDTDSICSAIAYAHLKNSISEEKHVAKRAGDISEETKFVLNAFKVEAPDLIQDIGTQVKDIEIRKTEGVDKSISLKKAWNIMKDIKVATLPVVNGGRLTGIITVKDIATANMDIYDNTILATSKTQYTNILETLDATLIVGSPDTVVEKGKILIATSNPDTLENYIEEGDTVVLSNRYETQLCAIEMKAGCIIVCLDAPVSQTIKKIAAEHGCSIISTPHTAYTVARLINQSTPIDYFMRKEDLITFETDDFTDEIKRVMAKVRHRDFPVLDVYGMYAGMISRRSLLDVEKKKVILVDHNEKSQAVDGIEGAEIIEIIDHHRLGSLETISPVFFRNQPVGCTATIIYKMYKENGVEIPKQIAGILCSAIITDTLMFRSPTSTLQDKTAAEDLAKIAEIEIEPFSEEIFFAGSNLKDKSPEEIIEQDFKTFTIKEISFGVSQINFMNSKELEEYKLKLSQYIKAHYKMYNMNMLFIMLTNIMEEYTDLIFAGEGAKEIAETATKQTENSGYIHLKGVVSRKKQLLPTLMATVQQ